MVDIIHCQTSTHQPLLHLEHKRGEKIYSPTVPASVVAWRAAYSSASPRRALSSYCSSILKKRSTSDTCHHSTLTTFLQHSPIARLGSTCNALSFIACQIDIETRNSDLRYVHSVWEFQNSPPSFLVLSVRCQFSRLHFKAGMLVPALYQDAILSYWQTVKLFFSIPILAI